MKPSLLALFMPSALVFFCTCSAEERPAPSEEVTELSVTLPQEFKTTLGPSIDGTRKVYWSNGDRLALNGVASHPLSGIADAASSANFTFPGVINAPYRILYPSSFWKDETTITLPSVQNYCAGSFAVDTEPLAGYMGTASGKPALSHLCGVVQLSVRKDPGMGAVSLAGVRISGNHGEQMCGDFSIDYTVPSLTAAGGADAVELTVGEELSASDALDLFIVVPALSFEEGFTVVLTDNAHRTMTKVRSSAVTFSAGSIVKMAPFSFVPSAVATELEIADIREEVLAPDGYNITGRVVDSDGNPLEHVVVSDGLQCVRTMFDGTFYMESEVSDVKFVHVSTPSGYMPAVSGGIPRFYKAKADITPSDGVYDFGDYVLSAVDNPDRYTLLITADPQPRQDIWTLDKIAYKSLDACQDLYQELYDVSRSISGREVYGICLGDIVHEDMSLYDQYNSALGTLAYPTYNVIGNHDNDPSAADDDAGAAPFESYYGPRNYSFNIGGVHFVVLDNLIMKDNGEGSLTAYDQGLTDEGWAWLRSDLSFVPTTTKLMVCAHSPMFKLLKGSERTNSAYHAGTRSENDGNYGYGDLLDKYDEVHAWAGHTHVGMNYIYPSNHRHRHVQVHTLARSTGELWTNEYLAAGTPRGFTVVEIDNGEITWKFHPVTRQRGTFRGVETEYCAAGAPAYQWRDWDYDAGGVAVMRNGGGALGEDYQMHVYPRGAYDDAYVYANVFLWDENWELPVWTPDGGAPVVMERITSPDTQKSSFDAGIDYNYDLADTEFRTWYKTHADKSGGSLAALPGYRVKDVYDADGALVTIFRAPASASPSSGTVSVTDRFGNTYSRSVQWQ